MNSLQRFIARLLEYVSFIIRWHLEFLQVLYVFRFPLLAFLFLLGFMPLVLNSSLRSLLGNMFDLEELGVFWLSLFTSLLAVTALTTLKLLILYGSERFNFSPNTKQTVEGNFLSRFILSKYSILIVPLVTAVMVSGVYFFDAEIWNWYKCINFLLGIIAAFGLIFVADFVQCLFNTPEQACNLPHFLFPSNPFSKWASRQRLFRSWLPAIFNRIPLHHTRGYFGKNEDGSLYLFPGHLMALSLSLVFIVFYFVFGFWWRYFPDDSNGVSRFGVPAIAYLIVLVTNVFWILPAFSFFFDRYRIPVLLVAAVLLLLSSRFAQDQVYTVKEIELGNSLTPHQAMTANPPNAPAANGKYIIVVAANGGGIQAAAWTAQVLAGIERKCQDTFAPETKDFQGCGDKIRLISSVSGGSVGAMYFVSAYDSANGIPKDSDRLQDIVADAQSSSLSYAAWGLAFPDTLRSIVPFYWGKEGRGQLLEEAWRKHDKNLNDKWLGDWRVDVAAGRRPAVIFNTTITETGERLLISSTDICSTRADCGGRVPAGRKTFYKLMVNPTDRKKTQDLPVVTAARLSASFPYVSPAPRADAAVLYPNQSAHIVDGGYYDNYGISSLSDWLNEALREDTAKNIQNVLVVQIRGDKTCESDENFDRQISEDSKRRRCEETKPVNAEPTTGDGWYYQFLAPLDTLLNVRGTAQLSRNDVEFDLLQKYWKTQGVEIKTAIFEYEQAEGSPPLSWHLSNKEKGNIHTAWEKLALGEGSSYHLGDERYRGWKVVCDFINQQHGLNVQCPN